MFIPFGDDFSSKMLKRSIIRSLGFLGKTTGGQFVALEVILQTRAAVSFARTGGIRTIATFEIFVLRAFHDYPFWVQRVE